MLQHVENITILTRNAFHHEALKISFSPAVPTTKVTLSNCRQLIATLGTKKLELPTHGHGSYTITSNKLALNPIRSETSSSNRQTLSISGNGSVTSFKYGSKEMSQSRLTERLNGKAIQSEGPARLPILGQAHLEPDLALGTPQGLPTL